MIQRQLKLRLNKTQEPTLESWLWNLTGVYNWAIRKIEIDARDGIYHSRYDLEALTAGKNKKLAARISEWVANQRKDRNHKLSRRLVAENQTIVFSADRHKAIARKFGKSVASSGHYQLRKMLDYKCRAGGRTYIEVDPKNSTKTCSACGCLSGPSGLAGLSVRQWACTDCGMSHDRDVNAAINTLRAGAGTAHEVTI